MLQCSEWYYYDYFKKITHTDWHQMKTTGPREQDDTHLGKCYMLQCVVNGTIMIIKKTHGHI